MKKIKMNESQVQLAIQLATKYHKGQKRIKSNLDYITHPLTVADKFKNKDYKIVAIFHDIIEDTKMTLKKLEKLGFNKNLITAIDLLTKKKGQDYLNYLIKLKKNKIARKIKIEDIKHNLSDSKNGNRKDKYLLALKYLTVKK